MTYTIADGVSLFCLIVGFVATIVRAEGNARSSREAIREVKDELRRQHANLEARIDTLFGQTRETDRILSGAIVELGHLKERTARTERHIDHLGVQIGVGRATIQSPGERPS